MTIPYKFLGTLLIFIFSLEAFSANADSIPSASITGKLVTDASWSPTIYLSYIPTLEDRNRMSADMIIGSAEIDEEGCFSFDISYLPKENNLFRLHMVKHDDSPFSLIIGGKNENHMFLIANGSSTIYIENDSADSLFEGVKFTHSDENLLLSEINSIKHAYDSTQMVESPSKRQLMEVALDSELRLIADTCPDALVGLYAIYSSHFEENYSENKRYYKRYLKKWRKTDSSYFEAFREKVSPRKLSPILGAVLLLIAAFVLIYFFSRKKSETKPALLSSLSVQERKVFAYLQEGMSNQQISDECNIGISTVKTHVRNVYSKLEISSRKEAMDFKV